MAHAEVPQVALEVAGLVAADRVRRPHGAELGVAEVVVEPSSTAEISELTKKCETDGIPMAPLGSCRTLARIRNRPVSVGVSFARLNAIVSYEPDDMTVVVEAGATLAEVNRHCGARAQHLPLDPPHPDRTTIGALIGAARSGPLRMSEGSPRDLLIGVEFVGHSGRIVKAGGRVVKNVAGYDLMKVMTGSFGTLGIITQAVFKVRPLPRHYAIVTGSFASAADAFQIGSRLHDTLPLWHLEVMSRDAALGLARDAPWLIAAGFCGNRAEVDYLLGRAKGIWNLNSLWDERAFDLYRRIRDFEPDGALVLRLSVPPGELAALMLELGADSHLEFVAELGAGTATLWKTGSADIGDFSAFIQNARAKTHVRGGQARVIATPDEVRGRIEMFDQPRGGELRLMRRLKSAFDPHGVFNPGCFVGGL